MPYLTRASVALLLMFLCSAGSAQQAPSIGYVFPPGGQAGSTVEVVLGGYDWTPDMELFVRDERIRLELTGSPGPVIVPEPPYWFGKKARRPPFMLPRETPARLTVPADLSPGTYRWQAANANGVTASGSFVVSNMTEIVEVGNRREPQHLNSLPVTVSGQIRKIEEVDEYQFTAPATGPMTCEIVAAAIGSPLTAVVEVRDASGRLIADAADTAARDVSFTFPVEVGQGYTARVYDVDFRGNRAFVYRLSLQPGPRLVATMPAFVQRGSTQDVQFIGYGLKTGEARLETISKKLNVPDSAESAFHGVLEIGKGTSLVFQIPTSDLSEIVEQQTEADQATSVQELSSPCAVTGVLSQRYGTDRYRVMGKQGDVWSIDVAAESIDSPLDVFLTIVNESGAELKRVDDVPGTTDARIEFTLPADGAYELTIGDTSGMSGQQTAIYRLVVRQAEPGFELSVPEMQSVMVDGSAVLAVKAERTGGFSGPIAISVDGLPEGVSIPEETVIPEKKNDLKLKLTAGSDAGATARMVTVSGQATIEEKPVTHSPEPVLVAVTMKPPFSIDAEGKNDVTKWPRGTTFPAPVLVTRDEGFTGDIVLEMAAKQGRHRQGIRGPEMTIKPGQDRVLYPVFLPEWLETTRTSRMVVNGVTKISDPTGRVRYSSSKLVTRIGFLPTGAMLKIESTIPEITVSASESFDFPVKILRAEELSGPVTVELVPSELAQQSEAGQAFTASTVTVDENTSDAVLEVTPTVDHFADGVLPLTARATATWNGHPVIAETTMTVVPVSLPSRKVALP